MRPHDQPMPEDGSWLSAEGPYRDYIAAWCKLNPNLKTPDSKNRWTPLRTGNARVVMLEIEQGKKPRRGNFSSSAELSAHLSATSAERAVKSPLTGRIYIMEGLAPDYIAALGDHFFMDPKFFMGQERTTVCGLSHEGSRQTPSLPSLIDSEKMFLLKYYELRDFGAITTFSSWCARTGRGISVTTNTRPDLYDLKLEPIGVVRRKCSFWSRTDEKGWDVVILCDPPIEQVFVQMGELNRDHSIGNKYSKWVPKCPMLQIAPNTPFSDGYVDFMKHPEVGTNLPKGPPRTSTLEDLCFYWAEHGSCLSGDSGAVTATVFIQKIVASNYMQLVEFIRTNIGNLEYQLSHQNTIAAIHTNWIEERWSDLQVWSRRCSEYIEDAESIMISLGISFSSSSAPESRKTDWKSCDKDFQYIHYRLKVLKASLDVLNNSITGLAGIAGNRQALLEAKRSLKEAKGIKTLTLLGMVFIPLAFSTGLFSMNDRYLPGTASFWIYFAVSIPLIVAVFLAAFLNDLGYDSDGEWNFKTFIRTLSKAKPPSQWLAY